MNSEIRAVAMNKESGKPVFNNESGKPVFNNDRLPSALYDSVSFPRFF
jgi:hypothetical protein